MVPRATAFPPIFFPRFPPLPASVFPPFFHYIYVGLASIYISHLDSYLQTSSLSSIASIVSLTPQEAEAEALCASNYPCPPGYRVPIGWKLSVGGVPVPPVPLGVARQMAITNHYYFELTPEQRRNPQWHPDYSPTWDAFFINRRESALARHEEDGSPRSNFNEAGRRLWWRGRTLQSVMAYRGPRLRYPQSQPTRAHPSRFDYRDPDASDDDIGDYDDYSGDVYRARHDYD